MLNWFSFFLPPPEPIYSDRKFSELLIQGDTDDIMSYLECFPDSCMAWCSEANDSVLSFAVQQGWLRVVEKLLSLGVPVDEVDDYDKTPLEYAVYSGFVEMVKLLCDHGASIHREIDGKPMWFKCVEDGKIPMAMALIAYTDKRDFELLKELLLETLHVDSSNYQYLPLAILESGFSCEVCDEDGVSILALACLHNNHIILDHLLDYKKAFINIDDQSLNGVTPLMLSASNGDLYAVRRLCEEGADLNLNNESGETALSLAVYYGHIQVVDYLLSIKANIYLPFNPKTSVYDIAMDRQDQNLCDLIQRYHLHNCVSYTFRT